MNVLYIAGRELRYIFNTTIGWLVLAGFLVMTGVFWATMVTFYVMTSTDVVANPYAATQMNVTDYLLAPFFGNTSVVLLMLTPALAMRLFSEEFKQRTIELLFTSPVSTAEIVLGKYLGALGFVAVMLLCTAYVPLSLWIWGDVEPGALTGGYLSLAFCAASIIAMGMLASAMTPNQIVAVVLAFSGALALWVLSWVSQDSESIFAQLSLYTHLSEMVRGVLRASDLAYFVAFIGFFLFATHQRVDSFRWR